MMGAQTHHGARWQTSDIDPPTQERPRCALSSSIGVPRQKTSAHAARMPMTQSREDGACTANALAQPSPKRVGRACGAVATAWLFVHSAEKVLTQHDPRTQCRSMDSAQNTSVSRRALEQSYCMVCARVSRAQHTYVDCALQVRGRAEKSTCRAGEKWRAQVVAASTTPDRIVCPGCWHA